MPEILALHHYPQDELRWAADDESQWFNGSRVLLCRQAATTGILFVHGWGGAAGTTWEAFPQAIRFAPETASADAFFLNYPTRPYSTAFCASQVMPFLQDLLHAPATTIVNGSLPRGALPRPPQMRYQRLIIVAHSMGAVVVRRALLDLDREDAGDGLDDDDRAKIRLLLFAPAHTGSTIPLLIASGFGLDWLPGATAVGMALSVYYRSLKDLERGCGSLTKLATDNAETRQRHSQAARAVDHLVAFVFHAADDKVVEQEAFDRDFPLAGITGKNHRSMCKPNENFRKPVIGLRAVLAPARPVWPPR